MFAAVTRILVDQEQEKNMKRLPNLAFFTPVFFVWQFLLPASFADTLSELDTLMGQSDKDKGEENYLEAEAHMKQALQLSVDRLGGSAVFTGKISRKLGEFYMSRGRYGEAETYLQRSLVIGSGYTGSVSTTDGNFLETRQFLNDSLRNPSQLPGNIEVANTLSSLANLYNKQGRYSDAERLLRRIIQIYESGGGSKAGDLLNYTPDGARVLAEHQRSLAQVLYKQGNVVAAESAFKRYVELVRKEKGNSQELADALRHLSAFYKSQNRSSDAEQAESEANEMR